MHPLEEAPERGRELPSLTFRRTIRHGPILPGPAYVDRYNQEQVDDHCRVRRKRRSYARSIRVLTGVDAADFLRRAGARELGEPGP